MQPRRFALIGHFHQAEDITDFDEAAQDATGSILTDSSSIDFTYTDSTPVITAAVKPEFIQDTVGAMLTDSATIDFTYTDGGVDLGTFTAATIPAGILAQLLGVDGSGSGLDADLLDGLNSTAFALAATTVTAGGGLTGSGTLGANLTLDVGAGTGITVNANDVQIASAYLPANPTGTIGLTAVNGSATSTMRSDGAPALSQAIAPTWTNDHIWTDNDKVILGTGSDLSIYHDGTDSFLKNVTGALKFADGSATRGSFIFGTTPYLEIVGTPTVQLGAGSTFGFLAVATNHELRFYTNNTQQGLLDTVGNMRWHDGASTAPAYSFLNSANTGIWSRGGGILSAVCNYNGKAGFDMYSSAADALIIQSYDGDGYGSLQFTSTVTLITDEASTELARFDTSHIYMTAAGTTASAANAFLNSGSSPANELLRSTSSRRYKRDIRDLPAMDVIDQLRPVLYKSRCKGDDKSKDHLGFIAEEVAEFAPELVHFNGKVPESVQYERIAVGLVAYVKQLKARIESLEAAAFTP